MSVFQRASCCFSCDNSDSPSRGSNTGIKASTPVQIARQLFQTKSKAELANLKAAEDANARMLERSRRKIAQQAKRMSDLQAEVQRLRLQEQKAAARAELEALALSELRKRAKAAGMADPAMSEIDDLDSKKAMKAAFIEFIESRPSQDEAQHQAAVETESVQPQHQEEQAGNKIGSGDFKFSPSVGTWLLPHPK